MLSLVHATQDFIFKPHTQPLALFITACSYTVNPSQGNESSVMRMILIPVNPNHPIKAPTLNTTNWAPSTSMCMDQDNSYSKYSI